MKKFLPLLAATLLVLTSCERMPFADFYASAYTVDVYENVYFTNNSSYEADYFEWDFGDGTVSNAYNVMHRYEYAGIYPVTLTVYNGSDFYDTKTIYIEVLTTSLHVIVEEYYTHERIQDASIILYPTINDWNNMTNPIVEGFSDANGVARFENLDPVNYFLDVWHQNYNNYQLATEDVAWIMTDKLVKNAVNEFVAYVDYVGSANRKDGKKTAQYKVLKLEPRLKKNVY